MVVFVLGFSEILSAQDSQSKTVQDSLSVKVYFHVNKTYLDTDYHNNGRNLEDFVKKYRRLMEDKRFKIVSFNVVSSASPEGYHSDNIGLAHGRAVSIIDFVERYVSLQGVSINIRSIGNNWDKFRTAIERSDMPEKQEILNIIDSDEGYVKWNGKDTDVRMVAIRQMNDGATYDYLKEYVLPDLRASYATLTFKYEKLETPVLALPVPAPADSLNLEPEKEKARKLVFAFRTNMLLPLLNGGFEVPIGNRWSVGFVHYYPWLWRYWPTKSNEYCYETMWGELDVRYWFGQSHKPGESNYKNRLQGHSIGVFGQVGYYDVGWNWTGHQGEFATAGVDYLFGKSFCKGAIHLEFNIGIGYFYSQARTYDVYEYGGLLYRRKSGDVTYKWFGPVKAGVTLVVPIYSKYTPKSE